MTLRPLIAAIVLLAAPAALAASAPPTQPNGEAASAAAAATPRGVNVNRRDRVRPNLPLKPRVIEAPGAAVMMIPASFDPTQNGPFSQF